MIDNYRGPERRQFVRLEHSTPLAYKVCKKETVSKLLEGYTSNVSRTGLLCRINDKVEQGDILWLSFDRTTLGICEEIEKNSFIYQGGVIGKVVRIDDKKSGAYDVGLHFITREEKDNSNIHPKIYYLEKSL